MARLGQAQVLACPGASSQGELNLLDEKRFVQPGPLWWVFDWAGASRQWRRSAVKGARPEWKGFEEDGASQGTQTQSGKAPDSASDKRPEGVVLLIDEIDKADTDVPNALLECLGQGWFAVPYFDKPVRAALEGEPPLIVITTNEEKELPAAFVRRCVVLGLGLPADEKLAEFLVERGRAHFGGLAADGVLAEAALQLVKERQQVDRDALFRPGQAEYLDIVRAVVELAGKDDTAQRAELAKVSGFCLRKAAPPT